MKKLGVNHTLFSCYIGYITQGIINNFTPLLFLTFVNDFSMSLTLIGASITVNFGIQLLVDLLASVLIDKLGYRPCFVAAHVFAVGGLIALAFLPFVLPLPVVGLFIATGLCAIGGGLLEVIVSPLTEALPFDNKKGKMSLLHSFYCWGQLGVVLLSTAYFAAFGIKYWWILACIWAAIPFLNGIFVLFVPMYRLAAEEQTIPVRKQFRSGKFWFFALLMLCAGSSEISVAQWASAFAEAGLNITKTMGDLFGPCMFALCMGVSRVLFAKFGNRMRARTALIFSAAGCIVGYALCIFSPIAILALIGCWIIGFFVAVMWPCTLSFASQEIPQGGTAMFALFALFGDLGCSTGPTAVGALSDALGGNISLGLTMGALFPVLALVALLCSKTGRDHPLEGKMK